MKQINLFSPSLLPKNKVPRNNQTAWQQEPIITMAKKIVTILKKICFRVAQLLAPMILMAAMGCSDRYFVYKDTMATEIVSGSNLSGYRGITVCQGPATLLLDDVPLSCVVRCYDSNSDGEMVGYAQKGIDVFEYSLPELRKEKNGRSFIALQSVPYLLIMDHDYDGIGDYLYIRKAAERLNEPIFERIDLRGRNFVMDDFSPALFDSSIFK